MHPSPVSPPPPPATDAEFGASLCVLASGSSGNCSALVIRRGGVQRICLIDLGLTPRRTFKLLQEHGLRPDQIDNAIVTHLDTDHFCPTWLGRSGLPRHARLRMHERHAREVGSRVSGFGVRVEAEDPIADSRLLPFSSDFQIDDGVVVRPILMSHDEAGVTALRFDLDDGHGASGSLGFCTDLGHVTADLVEHLRDAHDQSGVDVLAIESNYCPKMQLESDRPAQLKRRIMGGSGHLSNQEALEAVQAIRPSEHVVLLHLSRQCNDPGLVADIHAGADYALTITNQFTPSRWVRIAPRQATARPVPAPVVSARIERTRTLWSV